MASKKVIVRNVIDSAKVALQRDLSLSESAKAIITSLMDITVLLSNHLGLNSSNSSKPPSTDPNRPRRTRSTKGKKRKPGAQLGHKGSRLSPVEKPDVIEEILIDQKSLPPGSWERVGFEKRQVFDIEVSFSVTEYQAEILRNKKGVEFIAEFPAGVTEIAQYGIGVKATSVYMSQYQMIPQERVKDIFQTQYGLNLSTGSVNNFNVLTANKLRELNFEEILRGLLIPSPVLHADETGINVNGLRAWIHCLCNEKFSYFHADKKRGQEAMDRMQVLPFYTGQLVHDHWKAYFKYICDHVLCNAHHIRELERAFEQDGQRWALRMQKLLFEINEATKAAGGELADKDANRYRKRYQKILRLADKECPENLKQRAQSKSRNLLERLLEFEDETLRFMENELVPFTNNQGERDLRMTKVQQKISGCFRAMAGAENFCLIRSYLSTCRKHGIHPIDALRTLLCGKLPDFMTAP